MSIIKRVPNFAPIMCNDQKLGLITQLYGANHTGVDSCVIAGLDVCAICDSTVQRVYWSDTHGNCLEYGYGDFTVRYCHMAKITVCEGQAIQKNQVVGQMGSTGSLTNQLHLHTSILIGGKLVNPLPYLDGSKALPNAPVQVPAKSVETIAKEVLAGKWGNGADRKSKLATAGYDYTAVQQAVNALLLGVQETKPVPKKSVEEIAKEVLRGAWGNGAMRRKKLEAAGYNYKEVQAVVNKLLK